MDEFASRLAQWLQDQPEAQGLELVHNADDTKIWGFYWQQSGGETPISLQANVTP